MTVRIESVPAGRYVSLTEAAVLLGRSRSGVSKLRRVGRLLGAVQVGGVWWVRYPVVVLDAYTERIGECVDVEHGSRLWVVPRGRSVSWRAAVRHVVDNGGVRRGNKG